MVLASGSVLPPGSVSVATALPWSHRLLSMSRDGKNTLFSITIEKGCLPDKYE